MRTLAFLTALAAMALALPIPDGNPNSGHFYYCSAPDFNRPVPKGKCLNNAFTAPQCNNMPFPLGTIVQSARPYSKDFRCWMFE